jgi:signal transduction histidine kinase/PAS domain-containing protein
LTENESVPRQSATKVLNRYADDVWTLFDTSRANQTTLDAYLTVILDRCADWFKATGASIFLLKEGESEYVLAAKAGYESSVPDDATIEAGVGIAGTCIVNREPILLDNPMTHPALAKSVKRRNQRLGSSMVVPLLTPDGECIGVLNLSRSMDEDTFTNEDLRYARSLAGHIALAVANGRLLSKLRQSVAQATQLHAKLDTILSSLAVAIVVVESHGTVTHANPEAIALVSGAPCTDQPFSEFASHAPEFLQLSLRQVASSCLSGTRSTAIAREEQSGRAFSLTGSPLPGGGATIAIQDSTEHEHVMREIARVRRLAEIGQMTATIAHEIRNPLWAMQGAAQVIQSDPKHAAEFGKIIEEEVVKLAELCNGFLDFAKPLELQISEFDLCDIVAKLADQHLKEFSDSGVELVVKFSSQSQIISADRNRFIQVARNLLLNALQACKAGDKVTVECKKGEFLVRDSGAGMEQIVLDKLFTPFFTTKPDGTGLGLSTVRKIVDAHGVAIAVKSKIDEGTEFVVNWSKKAA